MTKPAPFGRVTIKASSKRALPNNPFPSCFLPLFQDEPWCTTFHMEMSLICKTMNEQENFIFHMKSFCVPRIVLRKSQEQLGNGLLRAALLYSGAAHNRKGDAFSSKYRTLTFSPESLFLPVVKERKSSSLQEQVWRCGDSVSI